MLVKVRPGCDTWDFSLVYIFFDIYGRQYVIRDVRFLKQFHQMTYLRKRSSSSRLLILSPRQVGLMRNGSLLAQASPESLLIAHRLPTLEDVFLKLCQSVEGLQKTRRGSAGADQQPVGFLASQRAKQVAYSHNHAHLRRGNSQVREEVRLQLTSLVDNLQIHWEVLLKWIIFFKDQTRKRRSVVAGHHATVI